jgi:hypothetical protein
MFEFLFLFPTVILSQPERKFKYFVGKIKRNVLKTIFCRELGSLKVVSFDRVSFKDNSMDVLLNCYTRLIQYGNIYQNIYIYI